jgi:hypothetical protein
MISTGNIVLAAIDFYRHQNLVVFLSRGVIACASIMAAVGSADLPDGMR